MDGSNPQASAVQYIHQRPQVIKNFNICKEILSLFYILRRFKYFPLRFQEVRPTVTRENKNEQQLRDRVCERKIK